MPVYKSLFSNTVVPVVLQVRDLRGGGQSKNQNTGNYRHCHTGIIRYYWYILIFAEFCCVQDSDSVEWGVRGPGVRGRGVQGRGAAFSVSLVSVGYVKLKNNKILYHK